MDRKVGKRNFPRGVVNHLSPQTRRQRNGSPINCFIIKDLKLVVTFKIPYLPPSINQTYKINYRTKAMYLDQSAVDFKRNAMLYIPFFEVDSIKKMELDVEYHGQFMNKNGTVKRRDGQNLDKVLYDTIFGKLGVDDSIVWKGSWTKIHNETQEYTMVTIKQE